MRFGIAISIQAENASGPISAVSGGVVTPNI
jgi:hypothetical protein